ncbi:MAG: type I methionyl aminopeptidase [Actinobacteria bacterium]|nr:type I methionyl aminopeptidase [Actinomycetota bacterium]
MIIKKSAEQIEKMYRAGQVLAEVMVELKPLIVPGAILKDIDAQAERSIRLRGGVPSFLGYRGFPASICASINDVVVHGIPDERALKPGEVIALDCGLILDGWHADNAYTYGIGTIDPQAQLLLDITQASLEAAIEQCKPGNHLGDVGYAVQKVAEDAGFFVVREYAGHQIGRSMHEGDVQVPNYGKPGRGIVLEPGMVFAVEPMINSGTWQTRLLDDGWTVVTMDGSLSAHFEHTVAITEHGPRVLTALQS